MVSKVINNSHLYLYYGNHSWDVRNYVSCLMFWLSYLNFATASGILHPMDIGHSGLNIKIQMRDYIKH